MTILAQLTVGQAQKETTANDNFESCAPMAIFSERVAGTSALNFGFYGGILNVDGTLTTIADGAVALTASATNFVEVTRAGVMAANIVGFGADRWPLFTIVTGVSTITTTTDNRFDIPTFFTRMTAAQAVTTVDVTLTAVQARASQLTFSGALTADRNAIVPTLAKKYSVNNICTGGAAPGLFRLVLKTVAGLGVEIPRGSWVDVECDGTNVVALNPGQFVQTMVFAATLGAHDAANGEKIIVGLLTAGIIIPAPTNAQIGQRLTYAFKQGPTTGAFAITWNAIFKKAADPAAGAINTMACTEFLYNGSNWIQQGGAVAWFT